MTFSSVLSVCGSNMKARRQGEYLIHDQLIRSTELLLDAVVGNTLVDMYGKFGMKVWDVGGCIQCF